MMTTEKILIAWLLSIYKSSDPWFHSYDLEAQVPIYGRLAHQKEHTASTYSRAFRKLRESNKLAAKGYKLEDIVNKNTKAKGWKIVKDT
jgi:hypothetical protein